MKKSIFITLMLFNSAFAGVWSSSSQDGIQQAYDQYNSFIKNSNNEIVKKYENLNNNAVDKILKNDELKRKVVKNHRELLKEEITDKSNFRALILKYKYLNDIEAEK